VRQDGVYGYAGWLGYQSNLPRLAPLLLLARNLLKSVEETGRNVNAPAVCAPGHRGWSDGVPFYPRMIFKYWWRTSPTIPDYPQRVRLFYDRGQPGWQRVTFTDAQTFGLNGRCPNEFPAAAGNKASPPSLPAAHYLSQFT